MIWHSAAQDIASQTGRRQFFPVVAKYLNQYDRAQFGVRRASYTRSREHQPYQHPSAKAEMKSEVDITIVGAGPYGLSIGAHLAHIGGLDVRIIGCPMRSWLNHMPRGMHLKSAGFASNLADLQHRFSLRQFCQERGVDYDDFNVPVPVDLFAAYGTAFQKRFLPGLEERQLVSLRCAETGFVLETACGERIVSREVILAVGLDDFTFVPPVLANLPVTLASHGNRHHVLDGFRDRDVVVVGGGASAIDLAVLLHEAQARVTQVTRRSRRDFSSIWHVPGASLWSQVRRPLSGIGPGWRSRLCTDLPGAFRHLPDSLRLRIVKRHLGPSAGWFMTERAAGVPLLGGHAIRRASTAGERVMLELDGPDGTRDIAADHVIAATGYRIDLSRLGFLDSGLRNRIRLLGSYPRLKGNFESSVPGLYFAGPITTGSFGPVMRFVVGAEFTARRLAAHFSRPRQVDRQRRLARPQA